MIVLCSNPMSSAISCPSSDSVLTDGAGLSASIAVAPAICILVSTKRFSFLYGRAGVVEKARADAAAMHRGVEGTARRWKRH